jgi:16S rRNA (guanine(966)-N(2))-methyltransferase RsmD
MRVIAGEAKGRKLAMVPGDTTRPVMDRVKESVFNIIRPWILDADFLDLFAGTGSVGIEALSQGARRAVFVEKEYQAIRVIKANLKTTGLQDRAKVIRQDVFDFLASRPESSYDFIYVAPPQYHGLWAQTLTLLDERNCLASGGQVIVQIDPIEYEDEKPPLRHLAAIDERKYGNTLIVFYEWQPASKDL